MSMNWRHWAGTVATVMGLTCGGTAWSQEATPKIFTIRLTDGRVASEEVSPYYIGLGLDELSADLKAHFNLERGVMVTEILPDSPAAKAELKKHDIVLKVGEAEVKSPQEVMKAVGQNQDKELTLVILRGGKELSIKVTPAKRPAELAVPAQPQPPAAGEGQPHFRFRLPGGEGRDQMFFFHPGVVMGKGAIKFGELPKNMKLSISKSGDAPAKIAVEKDDQKWEVQEDKLGDLPADVREVVERFLAGGLPARMALHMPARITLAPGANGETVPAPTSPEAHESLKRAQADVAKAQERLQEQMKRFHAEQQVRGPGPAPGGDMDRKLEELLKRLDRKEEQQMLQELQKALQLLRKDVDELKKN